MKFIDLFAGLGGFHLALNSLGHTCVFASEIDSQLQEVYKRNFAIEPAGDIREIDPVDIPKHDILCAGFPCQPFSKAGDQGGFADPDSGDLFTFIVRILRHHRPKYLLLENVANFQKHDSGRTWQIAHSLLTELGYDVGIRKLSPHRFGIPQIRERVLIVGQLGGLKHFKWPTEVPESEGATLFSILDQNPSDARQLSDHVLLCLEVWQDFLDRFPANFQLPSFPIWSMEFGATYPFEEVTPYALGPAALRDYLGSHGRPLSSVTSDEVFDLLPSYARVKQDRFPDWKVQFIRQNRELYLANKDWIDEWKHRIMEFPQSFQKFEWNCKGEPRELKRYVLQMRASGVRVKRPTTAPSLIAMTATQVPIITWESRYMTPRECARLQSMDELKYLPASVTAGYQALGNAVNVKVIGLVAEALVGHSRVRKRSL